MNSPRDADKDPASPPSQRPSPSLDGDGDSGSAFEVKFLLSEALAARLEQRAAEFLERDAFSDPTAGGSYRTTTVYFDTPGFDVLHRTPGFRRRKYRVRRYGQEQVVFLERKTRREDRVRKRRDSVPLGGLSSALKSDSVDAAWFATEVADRELHPVCRMSYRRTAFNGTADGGGVRLTFDRDIVGLPTNSHEPLPVDGATPLLPGQVVCEMKFRGAMPALFKNLVAEFGLSPSAVSKYRRLMGGTPRPETTA